MRGLLPHPGWVLGAAGAALLLTLPLLTASRHSGWRADLRTVTTTSVVVASAGAFLLAARYAARLPAGRYPLRLAVALAGAGSLAGGYLAAAYAYHRLVVPLEVDGALHGLPGRGLVLALVAAAFGVALGALWRRPAVLVALLVLLAVGEPVLRGWAGSGPFSATRSWLFGVGQPHDVPGCVSLAPSECVTWTYRYWPAGLVLAGSVLVALLTAAAVDSRWPAEEPADAGSATDTPAGRAVPGRRRYALAAGLVVAGLVFTPVVLGTGAQQATSYVAEGIGSSAPVGSPAEVPVPEPGRLAVFAVGLVDVDDCHAASTEGSRVELSPVLGTVRYGDGISYRWVGTFRFPAPGRWTVTCGGGVGEYLVAGVPRVGGLIGRLVEAPRPVGWLLGALPGLLVAAHTVVARRRRA
ncbi:hypothetical protein [Micromonospora sp. URMC 103]|uniref:hypothetical protein n=1 Tax=Micromonospora sp. URMC 103 TaxID=3423406 RepID=UPI003F1C6731